MKQQHRFLIACVAMSASFAAPAAELQVYGPGAVRPALQAVADEFQRASGHQVKLVFSTGGGTKKQIAEGAPADVVVLPASGAAELTRLGLVQDGSETRVGALGVGVGIKAGAVRPKVGSEAELRDTLLAAKSVTYADPALGGTAGTYFVETVLPRLGIAEQIKAKAILSKDGQSAVHRVVNGEVELVVVQSSEIASVAGAELVGPLPRTLQKETPYAALVLRQSVAPNVALAFVRHLTSETGQAAFRAAGFDTVKFSSEVRNEK